VSTRPDLRTYGWKVQAERVKARDGYACQSCGSDSDLTVDHLVPVAAGGTTEPTDDELVTLCRSCNSRKGSRTEVRLTWRSPRWL